MAPFSLLRLCLLSLAHAAAGLQPSDQLDMFALLGDDVTLPCGIPSVKSCSSITWNRTEEFGTVIEVAKDGKVTNPNVPRLVLLGDCSLEINRLVLDDARLYTCHSGALNSSVFLQILNLTNNKATENDKIELHCSLNTYKGLSSCQNRGMHINWTTADNVPLNRERFHITNPSECFSKLIFDKKPTDHHRKWKCKLTQNDTVKVTTSYTTTVEDGIEEVFAAVDESLSLSCGYTSSPGVGVTMKRAVGGRTLADDVSLDEGQMGACHVNKDSSLVISKVSALHAGDYQCSECTGQQKVLSKIRLHTLHVTSEHGPGGDNLTLTCVLTCAEECEKDFNLTWSGSGKNSQQSSLVSVNNTLVSRLFLPDLPMTSAELTCFAHREGEVMASKKWGSVNTLQTSAWVAIPLGLLMCIAAGGLYMCMKKKQNKDKANEESNIDMIHIYEAVEDVNNERLHQQRQTKGEAATTTDSFYDLLQAVN